MKAERRAESLKQGITSDVLKSILLDSSVKVKFKLDGKEVYFECILVSNSLNEVVIYLTEDI